MYNLSNKEIEDYAVILNTTPTKLKWFLNSLGKGIVGNTDHIIVSLHEVETDSDEYVLGVFLENVEDFGDGIVSFQMQVVVHDGPDGQANFLGIDTEGTLLEKHTSMRVGSSTKSNRVGGYTSRITPLNESGLLVKLRFDRKDDVELDIFKLHGVADDAFRQFPHFPELIIN